MVRTSTFWLALAAASSAVLAQECGLDRKCASAAACCSQYGKCGVGAYCLGGCDPRSSFSLESCVPAPVCQSKTHTFPNLDRVKRNTEYLGDSTVADWVSSGEPVAFENKVLLTMAPDTVGTLLASTTYMWYGNVQARFTSSRGRGVVTAFILLSDVKDEIDYEFVGVDLATAQTNYYFQGIPDYTHGGNTTLSDTFGTVHTYEIDWTPDKITWSIDGHVGRTINRIDTWNASSNQWMYPQSPSRVQLSLWPAGLASNGQGTVDWAGGLVDWNHPDVKTNGYYYAAFESVTIKCFNAPNAPGTNKGKSYTYSSYSGTNESVIDGSKPTVLRSFQGTGTDMNAGGASGTQPESVPGLTGGNPGGTDPRNPGGAASATQSGPPGTPTFVQGGNSLGSASGAEKLGPQEKVLKGSFLAGIVAVVAMMAL